MEENILICEDSLEGILTAVYSAYERHYVPEQTAIQTSEQGNLRLFASYEYVANDREKSEKVLRTLRRRFGEEGLLTFCYALASAQEDKATHVYRTIAKGLRLAQPARIFTRHADPDVGSVERLRLNTWNEVHHLYGFVRFRELENAVLFAEIAPKNNILTFLAEHFADRLPQEYFMLLDVKRELLAVHAVGKPWFLATAPHSVRLQLAESSEEHVYQELFRHFCHKIAIKERQNENLQNSLLPFRFRPYMTEFQEADKVPFQTLSKESI